MAAGLLDTSVVIDWHDPVATAALPEQFAILAVTVAEPAAGPHLAADGLEAARRQACLQEVESRLEPIPFDTAVVGSYGLVVAAIARQDRKPAVASRTCSSRPPLTPTG